MKKKLLIFVFMFVVFLVGCTKQEQGSSQNVIDKEPIVDNEIETPTYKYTYPLTGIGTNEVINRRAIAVMINNHTSARPHTNLHKADIIYELLAEGDITRFLAIYHSNQPEAIGPIRSARDYYIELAKGYQSIYVAHGYSPDAYDLIQKNYIDSMNGMQYDGTLFYRSKDRKAPHNSYTTFENIIEGSKQKKYDTTTNPPSLSFLTEEETQHLEGNSINKISVQFYSGSPYNSEYVYDSNLQKYTRYSNNVQTADDKTKEALVVDNLFIVETKHEIIDSEGRRRIDLTSGGKAYLFQKGILQEIEWMNKEGQIVPSLNKKEIGLIQGQTWITFVPTNPGISNIVTLSN